MDEKKQCGSCLYFLLDTRHLPRRHECDYYHRRIIGLDVPKWCKAYRAITAADLSPQTQNEANNGR